MTDKNKKTRRKEPEETVEARLRRGIRAGRYIPGQRLIEIDLIRQLDATQRQVRDALRRLESEGLLSIEKNRGASVRKISRREVECILDVLDALSMLAVRQSCEKMEDPGCRKLVEDSLKAAIQFRKNAVTEKRVQKFLDENLRFWDSIASVVDNPVLWDIRERLETLLFRLQMQGLTINSDPDQWITNHEDILSAILAQDTRRAGRLVLQSSKDVRNMIVTLGDEVFN